MAYEFVKELSEARLFRKPSNIPEVSIGTIGENLFNAALALHIMKYENPKVAAAYAQRTLATGLDNWRSSGSDFNNMVQILATPEKYKDKVNVNKSIAIPELQLKTWLRNISNSKYDEQTDRRFFLALQRQLGVTSPGLISARRVVADWSKSLGNERAQAIGKVHRGMSQNLKQSDLFAPFARIASKGSDGTTKSGGVPLWAKLAAAGVGGYHLGKKIASW